MGSWSRDRQGPVQEPQAYPDPVCEPYWTRWIPSIQEGLPLDRGPETLKVGPRAQSMLDEQQSLRPRELQISRGTQPYKISQVGLRAPELSKGVPGAL